MRLFWRLFHRIYANNHIGILHFPIGILSNFDFHYALFDDNGDVKDGAKTFLEGRRKQKETGLWMCRIHDRR